MEIGAHDGRSEHSDTSDVIKSLSQNFSPEALQSALKLAMAMKNAPQEEYDSLMRLISQPNEAPDSEEKPSVEAADGCENDNSLEKLQHLPELSDQVEKNNIERDHVVSNGLGEGKDSHIADENAASGNNSYEIEGGSVFTSKDDDRFSEVSDEEDKIKDQFRSEADGNIDDCVTTVAVDDVNAAVDGKEDSKNDFVTDEKSAHQLDDTTSDNSVCSVDISNVTPIGEKKLSEFPYKDESLANTLSTTGVNSVSSFPEYANSSEDEKLPELLQGKAEDCFSEIEDVDGKEAVRVVSVESETNKASVEEGTPSMYHVSSVPQSLATDVLESDESKVDDADSSSSDEDEMASSSHSVVTSSESDLSEAVTPSESFAEQSEKLKGNVRQLAEGTQLSLLMTGSKDDDVAVIDDEMVPEDVCKEHSYVTAPVLERLSSLSSTGTQTSLENLSLVKDQVLSTHGNLDSILGGKECHASKLPFYYQPQIVVHEEKPVLVLQPLPSAASLSNGNAGVPGLEKGAFNASLPIILPLASPSIDEKTKEALFQRMNQTGTFLADQGDVEEAGTKEKNHLSGVLSTEISSVSQLNGEHSNKIPAAEKYGEHKDGGKTEGLPEWVASSELDKAFTAAAEEMPPTTEQEKPAILASPRVSFPSTNPFAKDLVVQQSGHHDVEAESPLNPSRGEAPLYSLFGPPSSPTVLQGARPKEFRAYQDPGIGGSGTNPFTPDPPKSTRQRRRHEQKLPSSTEVVVAAEVHSSVGHLGGINGSPRRRLSSESMVTLIETSYPDTSAGCAEPLGINETTNATKNPHPQQERNENGHGMPKPQKTLQKSGEIHLDTKKPEAKVPGSVAPHWVPDFACLNCTGCKVKFTLFIRKHHC
ncbi:uncharacterized protein LOC111322898 [Stylophora pistillata]|uniref:uncharacterized protein LOC111322898 n=1 Tax=Stylophora pistillata TaxID=50429 RepID=UPI000C046A32|nr:uncharacterized protein LOC111322898 [Stylophora pistillata]